MECLHDKPFHLVWILNLKATKKTLQQQAYGGTICKQTVGHTPRLQTQQLCYKAICNTIFRTGNERKTIEKYGNAHRVPIQTHKNKPYNEMLILYYGCAYATLTGNKVYTKRRRLLYASNGNTASSRHYTPIEMQGTVVLKNLSNGRSYTVSTFQENTATINVLRGAYMMDAEGTIRYRMADGTEGVKL